MAHAAQNKAACGVLAVELTVCATGTHAQQGADLAQQPPDVAEAVRALRAEVAAYEAERARRWVLPTTQHVAALQKVGAAAGWRPCKARACRQLTSRPCPPHSMPRRAAALQGCFTTARPTSYRWPPCAPTAGTPSPCSRRPPPPSPLCPCVQASAHASAAPSPLHPTHAQAVEAAGAGCSSALLVEHRGLMEVEAEVSRLANT